MTITTGISRRWRRRAVGSRAPDWITHGRSPSRYGGFARGSGKREGYWIGIGRYALAVAYCM